MTVNTPIVEHEDPVQGHLERRLFFLLIATLLWSTAMFFEASRISSPDFRAPNGCYFSGKPIVDAELALTPACFQSIVTQGGEEGHDQNISLVRANTYMDFVFIVLYWAIFVTFARIENGRFAKIASLLITLSALADVWENLRILNGLRRLGSTALLDFTVSRGVSLIKWRLLGLVFLLLAVAVWARKGRWYIWIAVLLVITGGLLLAGLAFPKAMTLAGYGFALVFFLLLARLWPYSADMVLTWIEYGFLLRFQITAALILFLALPLAYLLIPSLFVGVFDAQGFVSFVFIVWAAFQLAWTVMVTSRLVLVYGPDRFARATFHPGRVTAKIVSAFGLLAVPLTVILFIGSDSPSGAGKVVAVLLGLLLAIGVLILTASLHFAIEDPRGRAAETIFPSFGFLQKEATPRSRFWTVVGSWLAKRLPQDLSPGILDGERLRSGHEMALVAVAVFLSIYIALGFWFSPAWTAPEKQAAALFFLLLVLTIFTWLFPPDSLVEVESEGNSWYNGLEASLTKGLRHGLQFLASYTFSKTLDTDGADVNSTSAGTALTLGDQNSPRQRWGRASFDRTHRFVVSMTWSIPEPSHGLQHAVLGGWSVAAVATMQSGSALTIANTNSANVLGISEDRAQLSGKCSKSQLVRGGSVQSKLNSYFNHPCFTTPLIIGSDGVGTDFGNSATGMVDGPVQANLDFAITKAVSVNWLKEGGVLQLRTEFFNALNHPQFANPDSNFSSPTFGVISSTAVSPRVGQLALKLVF